MPSCRPILPFLTLVFLLTACALSAQAPGETFNAAGVNLHYTVQGHGDPVVLIHGLHSSSAMNWELPGVISELQEDYQVIAIDMPGHGLSDRPDTSSAYGVQMAEDVLLLLNHLNIRKAHIVGYSMGGMIAMKFLALHPDRVLSALIGGMGWMRQGSGLQHIWEKIPVRAGSATPAACITNLGALALTEAELKAIRVPVQVVVGARDPVKKLYVIPLQKVRPDWPVAEISRAGHLTCVMRPEFRQAVKNWLDKQRKP